MKFHGLGIWAARKSSATLDDSCEGVGSCASVSLASNNGSARTNVIISQVAGFFVPHLAGGGRDLHRRNLGCQRHRHYTPTEHNEFGTRSTGYGRGRKRFCYPARESVAVDGLVIAQSGAWDASDACTLLANVRLIARSCPRRLYRRRLVAPAVEGAAIMRQHESQLPLLTPAV